MNAKNKIVSFLVLSVILISAGVVIIPDPIANDTKKDVFWTNKTHSKKRYDIVVAGDSRVYRGISPDHITAQTSGLSTINLGYSSFGFTNASLDFIESKLNNNGIIIIGLTPYSLTPNAAKNEHYLQELNRKEIDIYKRLYLNKYLLPFARRNYSDVFGQTIDTVKEGYYEKFHLNGWVESYKIPFDSTFALAAYDKNFKSNIITDSLTSVLIQRIKKWRNNGIMIICFRPPSTNAMEELENKISGFNEKEIADRISKAGATWLNFHNKNFSSYDGSHLHYTSAIELSKMLGRYIKEKVLR